MNALTCTRDIWPVMEASLCQDPPGIANQQTEGCSVFVLNLLCYHAENVLRPNSDFFFPVSKHVVWLPEAYTIRYNQELEFSNSSLMI